MTDEEKKAIKSMQEFAHSKNGGCVTAKEMQIILNLIEKQDNRIKELEEVAKYWRKEFERVLTESNLIN